MPGLQCVHVVLDQTGQANDLDRVIPQIALLIIAEGEEKKGAGQEHNDTYTEGRSGKKLKRKWLGLKSHPELG